MKNTIIVALIFMYNFSFGQSGLKPGQLYDEGEEIYTPGFGIKSKVPAGWMGMLPQNTDIFLLSSKKGLDGQIFVLADTTSVEQMKVRWLQGIELEEGRVLKSDGNIIEEEGRITSGVVLTGGQNKAYTGYIGAQCGTFDRCVGAMLICEQRYLEEMKASLAEFMDAVSFVKPVLRNIDDSFDWKLFLANKYLVSYDNVVGSKSVNEIWLCQDGSFLAKLKRSGLVKGEVGKYKGKHKGTWHTNAIGETGILTLEFNKLPALQVDLKTANDQTFLNGRRHMVLNAATCK